MPNDEWKTNIRIKLIGMYQDDVAALGVLLTFLDDQERESSLQSTAWKMINLLPQRGLQTYLRTYTDALISEERNRRLSHKCTGICSANVVDGNKSNGGKLS